MMKDKMYEVIIVNMDDSFNTSVSDESCGIFSSLSEAKKKFTNVCKEIAEDRKNNSKWWQENGPVYVAIEISINYGDEDYDDWRWEDQIAIKEFRLLKTGTNRIKDLMNQCKTNVEIINAM